MRALTSSALAVLVLAAGGEAASFSRFTIGLGGDNHAARWKLGERAFFTAGTLEDGAVYQVGDILTWDVRLQCGGLHGQPGHPSNGFPVWGAANIVHNLEIRHDTTAGRLATDAVFFSSINDGTAGDPLAAAAFATSFTVGGNGPGRLIDTFAAGGPRFEPVFTYPTQLPGRLMGQGAGYREWNRSGEPDRVTTPGVGMSALPDGSAGLGVIAITEGQIDTSGMEPGTYVLRVLAAGGNNGLRGDRDLWQDQAAFAVAMNQTFGDEITFVLVPEPGSALLLLVGVLLVRRGAG